MTVAQHRPTGGLARIGLLALPVAAAGFIAAGPTGTTICPFALVTGTACPGCGLTRATVALGRGDLIGALTMHPLVLVVVAWLIGGWAVALARRSGYRPNISARWVDRTLWATGAAMVVVWLIRIATDTLPPV